MRVYLHPQKCDKRVVFLYLRINNAKVAQLVEHDLAKVGVAGSSPVFRSTQKSKKQFRDEKFIPSIGKSRLSLQFF